jgi:hypothetical protein
MNLDRVLRIVLPATLLVFLVDPAHLSGVDFQPVSQDELKMAIEPKAPGAPAIILFRRVDRDDKEAHQDEYVRIKILTDEGRKYADVEIPYWKGSLKITNFHARTIKPDGSITNFEGKPFDKTIVKARGVKILAKTFAMPEVSTGSIIEYGYRLQFDSEYVFDSHWIVSDELFTAHATFSLRASPFFLLKVHWNGLPPNCMTFLRSE